MFKYFRLLGMWKDVSQIYKEENGVDKPWYISRRFFGAIMVFVGGLLYTFFDITIPADIGQSLTDNLPVIGGLIKDLIPALVSLYGAITGIIGIIKKSGKDKK